MKEIDRYMAWLSDNNDDLNTASRTGSDRFELTMQEHLDRMVNLYSVGGDVLCALIHDARGYLSMVSLGSTIGVERVSPDDMRNLRPICLFVAGSSEARVLRVALAAMSLSLDRLCPEGLLVTTKLTEKSWRDSTKYMLTVSGFISVLPEGTYTYLQWGRQGDA